MQLHDGIRGAVSGMVVLDLMDLSQSDRPTLQKVVDAIFHPGAGITTDIAEIARIQNEGGQLIYGYFAEFIEERPKSPREDVVSGFIEAEGDGRPLTTEEMPTCASRCWPAAWTSSRRR
jgi:hypothetical protein